MACAAGTVGHHPSPWETLSPRESASSLAEGWFLCSVYGVAGFPVARQDSLATVSSTAESSSASRLWRRSGRISRSPRAASHDSSAAASRTRPCKISAVASPGLSCSARRAPSNHSDHCLTQHLLMTAVDSVRGVSTTRCCGQFHLLACQGIERDLLHANSVPTRNDAGRPGVRVGKQCLTASCSVHAVCPASIAWRHDRRFPVAGVQPVCRRHPRGRADT